MQNKKIIVVDDDKSDVESLIKVLWRKKSLVSFIEGDKFENLPEKPFYGIRYIFFDIQLIKGTPDKNIVSTAIQVFEKVISNTNGPFIIFLWTQHTEYAENVIIELIKKKYFFFPIVLTKSECKTDGKYDESKISGKIDSIIKGKDSFNVINFWEFIAEKSTSSLLNNFTSLFQFDKNWDNNMKDVFGSLAFSYSGNSLDFNKTKEVLKSAFLAFNSIYIDQIETSYDDYFENMPSAFSINKPQKEEILDEPKKSEKKEFKARLNSKIHLNFSKDQPISPGSVITIEKLSDTDQKIFDTITNDILKDKANENKENLRKESKLILFEVTQLCDFIQKNNFKMNRVVYGLIIKEELCNNIFENAKFIYQSPIIWLSESMQKIILDFRYFTSFDKSILKDMKPEFRIRQQLLNEIQNNLSAHINRIGLLAL